MSGSNLSVRVTADVVDLQTKFALAKAETAGLSAEITKLSKAAAAGNLSILPGVMQQLTGDLIATKTAAASAGAALFQASGGMLGMGAAAEHGHGSLATATREFRALFDELSSGRTRMTPGTLAIIAQRVLGLGPAALGAAAGVLGLVGGLAYLAVRAIEASRAIGQIDLSSSFAGNLDITTASVKRYADTLSQASNVSSSEARKIIASFAAVPGMTNAALATLTQTMSAFAQETGQDADKAAESLAKLFASDVSAGDFAKKIGAITQLTQEQLNQAASADRSGNSSQIMAEKLSLLNQAVTAASPALKNYNASVDSSVKNMAAFTAMISAGLTTEEAQAQMFGTEAAAIDKAAAARKNFIAIVASQPPSSQQTLKTGVSAAERENPITKQIRDDTAKANEFREALKTATNPDNVADLNAALAKTNEELSDLQFGPALEKMRADMAQVAAAWDGTQSGMLAKQIQIAQAELANTQQSEKQKLEVKTEISRLETQMHQATANEAIAAAREQVAGISAETNRGAVQRLEAERDVWQQTLAALRQGSAQYIEAERAMNADIVAIARERQTQAAAIARSDVSTDIAISRMKLEAEKQTLDAQVTATQAAVTQKFTALKGLANEEATLDEQALQTELATLNQGTAEYERVYNQIRELKAKLNVELVGLDRQQATDSKNLAKEEASDWKSAVGEIEGAESGMVSDLLNKRKSLSQSLLSIGAELVSKEIANDLRAVTTRILLQTEGNATQKALEQGGFLYHLAIQNKGTAATGAAQAQQNAAVATGNATRTASIAAAAAAAKAAAGVSGTQQVMSDAAQAYAGTYASVAQIPYVGYILAPAAAAAAFADVSAFAGLASLDVGTNYVPRDMTARIHQGEAVVPKAYNPAAGGGGFGTRGDTHVHLNLSAFDASGMANLVHSQSFRDVLASSIGKYVNRGGRG